MPVGLRRGCLRENGKLLILLDTNDLIEMNKIKEKQEDPAEYLLDKLDNLLLDLEKNKLLYSMVLIYMKRS